MIQIKTLSDLCTVANICAKIRRHLEELHNNDEKVKEIKKQTDPASVQLKQKLWDQNTLLHEQIENLLFSIKKSYFVNQTSVEHTELLYIRSIHLQALLQFITTAKTLLQEEDRIKEACLK